MKIMNNPRKLVWLFAINALLLPFYSIAERKVYGVKTESHTAYTQYDPAQPGQTITVFKHNSGRTIYSGIKRNRSLPAEPIEFGQARDLFLRFEKECTTFHSILPR